MKGTLNILHYATFPTKFALVTGVKNKMFPGYFCFTLLLLFFLDTLGLKVKGRLSGPGRASFKRVRE